MVEKRIKIIEFDKDGDHRAHDSAPLDAGTQRSPVATPMSVGPIKIREFGDGPEGDSRTGQPKALPKQPVSIPSREHMKIIEFDKAQSREPDSPRRAGFKIIEF